MHNDDFTTMDFVVEILITIFRKDPLSAEALMMDVHKKGMRGVLAQYADPELREKEKGAWERALVDKYGNA